MLSSTVLQPTSQRGASTSIASLTVEGELEAAREDSIEGDVPSKMEMVEGEAVGEAARTFSLPPSAVVRAQTLATRDDAEGLGVAGGGGHVVQS